MATAVKRKHVNPYIAGCVVRRHAKAYLWTNPDGERSAYPFSYFVYDPPIMLQSKEAWGITDSGITYNLRQGTNIYDAFDVVGYDNYPNPSDVLEEWENGWMSTLAPTKVGNGMKLLTPGKSRVIAIHSRGWIDDYRPYREQYIDVPTVQNCFLPDDNPERRVHLKGDNMCASLHWQHVVGGDREKRLDRRVERTIGQKTYAGVMPIDGVEPECHYAAIAWRPVDEIHVVDTGIDDNAIKEALDWLINATAIPAALPIFVTDN
jgi:hypothetical protein